MARPPQKISLKDVIEVIEGKIYLVNCLLKPATCGKAEICPIAPMWAELQSFIIEVIASITIDDIIHDQKKQKMLTLLETCQEMYREQIQKLKPEYNER